ncbi:hypothetical protein Hanom_Chr01g00020931 [Helianthus anomalus]
MLQHCGVSSATYIPILSTYLTHTIHTHRHIYTYRLDCFIHRILGGAPKPRAIITFPFRFQNIRNFGFFKAMFFHTNSGC